MNETVDEIMLFIFIGSIGIFMIIKITIVTTDYKKKECRYYLQLQNDIIKNKHNKIIAYAVNR